MRVGINCRSFLKKEHTGIGRYAYHLVKSLSDIDHENEYQLYARKGLFSFNKKLPPIKARNFTPRIDLFNRGPASTLKQIDIYHFPSPELINAPDAAKVVVTIHDVIFKAYPQGHTQDTIDIGQKQFADIEKKANKIICCSQATISDLQKYFQIPSEKIALVYQGVDKKIFYSIAGDEVAQANELLDRHGIDDPFILSVGTIEPRKNLVNLIHAFHQLRSNGKFSGKLVIIGMKGWMDNDIGALIVKLGLVGSVAILGYVTDEELRYFYNKAKVFVFPSFYEGFGFPIVEAFSCGAAVVTSNVSSCPEIAGDAALTVDPNSTNEIADAIYRVISEPGLKERLQKRGLQRAQDFDFQKTAQETLNVYNEVFNHKGN